MTDPGPKDHSYSKVSGGEATLPAGARSSRTGIKRGSTVGRYVVLSRLGAGAMGVVYAAYDPELDRKVALKLLHPLSSGAADDHRRLLREAQAMARLNHPNVITVHDVGEHEGRVFLAMEFIDGTTLADWLETPRAWREVLGVFVPAGRGLAAAHAKGIVHRDFKPENIMLEASSTDGSGPGRVRVLDFGVARAGATTPSSETALDSDDDASTSPSGALLEHLTRKGSLIGTPAYMAPEQHLGIDADERADQFSFCVALCEGLYGERPYAGDSMAALTFAVTQGDIRDPPKGHRVPARIRRVVVRGLATAPEDRFESMAALIDELERDPTRRNRLVGGAVASVVLLGLAFGGSSLERAQRRAACEADGAAIEADWNETGRQRVLTAMLATKAPHAQVTFDKARPWLDRFAADWRQGRAQACIMATVEDEMTQDTYGLAEACFDQRRVELTELVRRLAHSDAGAISGAVLAATALPSIAACQDSASLIGQPKVPPGIRDQVVVLRRRLAAAAVKRVTARADEALADAREIEIEARALGHVPLHARTRLEIGNALEETGDYEAARLELIAAELEAGAVGADEIAAAAAETLVQVVGHQLARHDDGMAWVERARMWHARLGVEDDPLRRATLLLGTGVILDLRGDFEQARTYYQETLSLYQQTLGPGHPHVARSIANIGTTYQVGASYDKALEFFERALALQRTTFGEDHPSVARFYNNLAIVHASLGARDEALAAMTRAHEIKLRVLEPSHPEIASSLANLGSIHQQFGDFERASELHERSLAMQVQTLGADHPDVASTLTHLGAADLERGQTKRARERFEAALAIFEGRYGPEHADVAGARLNLGRVQETLGELDGARATLERALGSFEAARGPDHPDVAFALFALGGVELQMKAFASAHPHLGRALAIWERTLPPDHHYISVARFAYARASHGFGRRAAAVELAEQARDAHREAGNLDDLAEVERWLDQYGK